MKLPLKLAILVIVIFGLLFLGMALWRPMKVKYYTSRLDSENAKVRADAVKKLLALDPEPVFRHYTERYESKEVKERMAVVRELCRAGGKELMREIFRNRCYSEQVRIPAGTLTLAGGSKVEIKSLYVDKYEVTREKFWVYCILAERNPPNYSVAMAPDGTVYNLKHFDNETHPVSNISIQEAGSYADWLGMRLPKDDEWMHAAEAGYDFPVDYDEYQELMGKQAWCKDNSQGHAHPVGLKRPNKWGLYDMYGNVSEFTEERLFSHPYASSVYASYLKEKFVHIMGGNYTSIAGIHSFGLSDPEFKDIKTGFRCMRDIK